MGRLIKKLKQANLRVAVLMLSIVVGGFLLSCRPATIESDTIDRPLPIGSALSNYPAIPGDWKKVETDKFYLYIPPSLLNRNAHGIDSFVAEYEDETTTVSIEYGMYTFDLNDLEARYQSAREFRDVNGEYAKLVLADLNSPKAGDFAVNADGSTIFRSSKKNLALGAFYSSHGAVFVTYNSSEAALERSRLILNTIKFKNN